MNALQAGQTKPVIYKCDLRELANVCKEVSRRIQVGLSILNENSSPSVCRVKISAKDLVSLIQFLSRKCGIKGPLSPQRTPDNDRGDFRIWFLKREPEPKLWNTPSPGQLINGNYVNSEELRVDDWREIGLILDNWATHLELVLAQSDLPESPPWKPLREHLEEYHALLEELHSQLEKWSGQWSGIDRSKIEFNEFMHASNRFGSLIDRLERMVDQCGIDRFTWEHFRTKLYKDHPIPIAKTLCLWKAGIQHRLENLPADDDKPTHEPVAIIAGEPNGKPGVQTADEIDLQYRLNLVEHEMKGKSLKMFGKLRDMKTHTINDLANVGQNDGAASKMASRISNKILELNLNLDLSINGSSYLLKNLSRQN